MTGQRTHLLRLAFCLGCAAALSAPTPWATASPAAPPRAAIPAQDPAGDAAGGAADLVHALLTQTGTTLSLVISTSDRLDLPPTPDGPGRGLCVELSYGRELRAQSRLCAYASHSRPMLAYEPITPQAASTRPTALEGSVTRPDERTLQATFTPLAGHLPPGMFAWRVRSTRADPSICPATVCADDLPDAGTIEERSGPLIEPACFGAAARDRLHPCSNPALRRAVTPTPAQASIAPNAPCEPMTRRATAAVCAFGATIRQAEETFALIGDSHGAHWRAALEVVAQAQHWRGLSITRSSCPLNQSTAVLVTAALTERCRRWNAAVVRWLADHPAVHMIFVSADARTEYRGSAVDGFRAALRAIPRSVRRIFVLRDTPRIVGPQAGCVDNAVARHRPAGALCAQSRASNLVPDPQVAAARTIRRARVIDLSSHMCDARRCFAVVGGVLLRKDGTHLTSLFATTLGPYVLRSVHRTLLATRPAQRPSYDTSNHKDGPS